MRARGINNLTIYTEKARGMIYVKTPDGRILEQFLPMHQEQALQFARDTKDFITPRAKRQVHIAVILNNGRVQDVHCSHQADVEVINLSTFSQDTADQAEDRIKSIEFAKRYQYHVKTA